MNSELREAIKAAVLADQAPDIIQVIEETCKEESDRLMKIWYDSQERKAEDERERKAEESGRWKRFDGSRKTPRWMWWSYLTHSLEYVIRDMREKIAQRDMTRAEIDKLHKDAEIARARHALAVAEGR